MLATVTSTTHAAKPAWRALTRTAVPSFYALWRGAGARNGSDGLGVDGRRVEAWGSAGRRGGAGAGTAGGCRILRSSSTTHQRLRTHVICTACCTIPHSLLLCYTPLDIARCLLPSVSNVQSWAAAADEAGSSSGASARRRTRVWHRHQQHPLPPLQQQHRWMALPSLTPPRQAAGPEGRRRRLGRCSPCRRGTHTRGLGRGMA